MNKVFSIENIYLNSKVVQVFYSNSLFLFKVVEHFTRILFIVFFKLVILYKIFNKLLLKLNILQESLFKSLTQIQKSYKYFI